LGPVRKDRAFLFMNSGMESIASWFATDPPASLGPRRRATAWDLDTCALRVAAPEVASGLDPQCRQCLRGLLWLWNDHLDEAHTEVQNLAGADAAFVHGIMHRREPDAGNSRYWFHRVGAHPVFEALAVQATPVLAAEADLGNRLVRGRRWDPMAFIALVDEALDRPDAPVTRVLEELQRLEMRALALHLAARGGSRARGS